MHINIESNTSNHNPVACREVVVRGTKGITIIFSNDHWLPISKGVILNITSQLDLNQVTLTLESESEAQAVFTKAQHLKLMPKLHKEDIKAELKKISEWCLNHDDPTIRTGVNSQIINLMRKVK